MSTYAGRNKPRQSERLDRPPPHDAEAEQAVIGCVLYDSAAAWAVVAACEDRFKGEARAFYDLRHQTVYRALVEMHRTGTPIDVITVTAWLRDRQQLDEAGGLAYLAPLPDAGCVPSNLPRYLEIVWEKFLARRVVQDATLLARDVMEKGGISEPMLEAKRRTEEEFGKLLTRGDITPQHLKRPVDFEEAFYAQFFGGETALEPGQELPIAFPMKVRRREMTLVSGDNGSGKSTFLNFVGLHLAAQNERVLIASLEMPPAVIMWILAAQLLGMKKLPDSDAARVQAAKALMWLQERFHFYDFTGIADWRELLDTFAYAATRQGMTVAILDSVMRIGIPDDDYAQQGAAAARFAQAAKDGNYHLLLVIHENKGDGKGKHRIRGSKQWSDNADNLLVVERNEDKGETMDKLLWEIKCEKAKTEPDGDYIREREKKLEEIRRTWDTQLILRKQRWPGTRQNGSKRFWFDASCFQFRDRWEDQPVSWPERWTKRKET